ncbi:unnamed protein product [Arabidopsis halleri]
MIQSSMFAGEVQFCAHNSYGAEAVTVQFGAFLKYNLTKDQFEVGFLRREEIWCCNWRFSEIYI